jgi:hypothetical protein
VLEAFARDQTFPSPPLTPLMLGKTISIQHIQLHQTHTPRLVLEWQ